MRAPAWLLISAVALTSCEEGGGIIRLRPEASFDPSALEFGEVSVDDARALPVQFENVGMPAFEVMSVEVPSGFSLRGIKDGFEGSTMQPGAKVNFEVAFMPTEEGEKRAQLIIRISDDQTVALDLHGVGTLTRLPRLVAVPESIDFGTVELGGESRAMVMIRNEGNAPGTIVRGVFENGSSEFGLVTSLPLTIGEGSAQSVELIFLPTSEGMKSERVMLELAEAVPPTTIALRGEGRVPLGEILCEPSRIDFGPLERGMATTRTVDCTARGGGARLIGAHIEGATDQFFVPTPPNTIDLAENQSVTVDVEFRPDGLPDVQFGELVVEYSGDGGAGSAIVELSGEVIPPPPTETAITIVLTWNTNNTDVDLHMVRPSSYADPFDAFFDPIYDCFFGVRTPDWNVSGNTSDDPFLDQDDVNGFGPETINLEQTSAGTYDVFVHYWGDNGNGNSTPTIEIHIAGQPAGTFNRPNLNCGEVWHVGTVNFDGTNGTFSPVNTIRFTVRGNC